MAKKDITPYRSKRINPYLNEPKRIGTGEPPKSAIPRIDEPLLKPPGGGGALSETVLEEPEQRKKSTNPYLKEQGPIALPPATVEPETKTPAPEPGRELQHELRPDVKVEEPPVEPRPVEPERVTTVERSPDFTETGDYIVTLADGSTQRIFRDTEQFGHSVWHRVGDTDNPTGIGSTRAEAVSYLERSILEKVEPPPIPEPMATMQGELTRVEPTRVEPSLTPLELRSQINKKTATKLGLGLYNYRGFEIERIGTEEGMAEYVRWNILAPNIPGAAQDSVLDPTNTFGDAKQVIDKWLANPEKYNSDYIFKFTDITKKATGGFIDKPLYERTL